MPIRLLWSPQAREDLFELYVAIGQERPDAAERFYEAIEAKSKLLSAHPRIGARRPEIRPTARILIEGVYLILYETLPDSDQEPVESVAIIRIVDGRRDLPRLF